MTCWNASAFSFTLLHLLSTLLSPSSAAAFRFQPRHDGKSHKGHVHRDLNARQDVPNAPFAGIEMISSPGSTEIPSLPTVMAVLPLDDQLETTPVFDATAISGTGTPSATDSSGGSSRTTQTTITSTFAPPIFPTTVIQIPIYTICPDTPGYINTTSTPSLNATATYANATSTNNATEYLPVMTPPSLTPINATALLPNGSPTTFLSHSRARSRATPALVGVITPAPAAPNARIILGPNGCQTLYSVSTTQLCSTLIPRGGQLPLTVTECAQWVTFSSTARATAVATSACPGVPVRPAGQDYGVSIAAGSPTSEAAAAAGGRSADGVAFFAAPWYEIAAGVVPGLVQVVDCVDDTGNNCTTSSERWSVSTSTSTSVSVRTVRFSGPAIFNQGASTLTKNIVYSSVHTSTATWLIPTILRAAIVDSTMAAQTQSSTSAERIVTVQMTVPQVRTWRLEEVHPMSTRQVTQVVTVTVPGTVRVTHTKTVTRGVW